VPGLHDRCTDYQIPDVPLTIKGTCEPRASRRFVAVVVPVSGEKEIRGRCGASTNSADRRPASYSDDVRRLIKSIESEHRTTTPTRRDPHPRDLELEVAARIAQDVDAPVALDGRPRDTASQASRRATSSSSKAYTRPHTCAYGSGTTSTTPHPRRGDHRVKARACSCSMARWTKVLAGQRSRICTGSRSEP
jgi:hypothetical protein